ncbi:MAG TPA: hypothetical protein VGJ07_07805 [Rugosimonospora sp.]|jgi:hypothetical protein
MNEDDLRVLLTRHEELAPPSGPVAAAIDAGYRRRRRWRGAWRAGGVTLVAVALVAGSAAVMNRWPVGGAPALSAGSVPSTGPGMAGRGIATNSAAPIDGRPLNVLVVAVDDAAANADPRGMVMHVTATGKQAYLIPVDEQLRGAGLAAAYHSGGIEAAGRAASRALGGSGKPALDAAVAVTYSGVQAAIDAAGGLTWCPASGCAHFKGSDVIKFLRQQPLDEGLSMVLEALQRLTPTIDPDRLDQELMAGGPNNIVLDNGGIPTAGLLGRIRGLDQLIELKEPASAADGAARYAKLFGADSDAYLSLQANGGVSGN